MITQLQNNINLNEIHIENISLLGKHGHNEEEKLKEQLFITSIKIYLDFSKTENTDDLNDTVNYLQIHDIIEDEVKNHSYNLIEKLAYQIANRVLEISIVEQVDIEIIKAEALSNLKKTGIPKVIVRKIKSK